MEPTHRHPVVAGHASLWLPRQPPFSVFASCRSHKRHHIALSPPLPLAHTRSSWPLVSFTRSIHCPITQASCSSPPVAYQSQPPLLSQSPCICAQGDSYGFLLLLLLPSPTMAPCFSYRPRPSPRFPAHNITPPPMAHHSLSAYAAPHSQPWSSPWDSPLKPNSQCPVPA